MVKIPKLSRLRDLGALANRLDALEEEVQECRQLNLRLASVLDVVDIDEGDVASTQPSIRKIMLQAAQAYAAAIIAVHNHPSGDPTPSEQDKLLTRDLVVAGRTILDNRRGNVVKVVDRSSTQVITDKTRPE